MQPDNEFVVVVDWAPLAEADSQFADWPTERGLSRDQVSDEDVRVDTGRGVERDLRRYRLRSGSDGTHDH
jgi:hypothetical protein